MLRRRTLLISGAAAALSPLIGRRALAARTVPRPLSRGSRIRAVNPGTWMEPDRDLAPLIARCADQGWWLEIPASVRQQWRYFSATDSDRAAEMTAAWRDPTVDAVFYLGGGWGGARVLEAGFRFPARPKWSLGFSDSSSLLLAQQAAGMAGAIHGSFGGSEAQWQRTVQQLRNEPVAAMQSKGLRPGSARGPLLVTNLTVATHMIGTPWLPTLKGAVLVLEDVGEAPYRIDRMLTQWRSAGLLQQLAGVACGRFSWAEDDILPGDFSMDEILEERLGDLGIPLVLNLPLGHGQPNQALPLGSIAELDGHQGTLRLIQ